MGSDISIIIIVIPLIILISLAFVFSNSTSNINRQQFVLNCPYPILNGIATFGSPPFIPVGQNANRLNYTVTWNNNTHGSFFECHLDPLSNPQQGATIIIKNYGASTFGGAIPYGWYAWLGDSITAFFGKLSPFVAMIYEMFNAPAQISGLVWFTYAQLILLALIGIGIVLAIRG